MDGTKNSDDGNSSRATRSKGNQKTKRLRRKKNRTPKERKPRTASAKQLASNRAYIARKRREFNEALNRLKSALEPKTLHLPAKLSAKMTLRLAHAYILELQQTLQESEENMTAVVSDSAITSTSVSSAQEQSPSQSEENLFPPGEFTLNASSADENYLFSNFRQVFDFDQQEGNFEQDNWMDDITYL